MTARTIIPFLCLCLAASACKRVKETAPPPSCQAELKAADECGRQLTGVREALDACAQRTAAVPVTPEAPIDEPPAKIRSGATYVLLQGDQVVVMNERGSGDDVWSYPYGSACRVDPDAKVKVVGPHVDKEDGASYLVRYSREPAPFTRAARPPEEDPPPRECPDGTLFFIDDPTVLFEESPDTRIQAVRKLLDSEKP